MATTARTAARARGINNVFATYSHGCLLAQEPGQVADFMLKTALERKYGAMELKPLDNSLEAAPRTIICKSGCLKSKPNNFLSRS